VTLTGVGALSFFERVSCQATICAHSIYPVRVGRLQRHESARLTCFYCLASRLGAIRLRAGKPDHIPLSVETGNKHWAVVGIAVWLVRTNERWLTAFWRRISQPFAEAALTKLRGTSAKLNRVICTEGRKAKLHCPKMFIAERQNVRAHWSSLASMETLAVPLA